MELVIIGAVKMTNIDISVLDGDGNYEFEFKHPKKASFGTCEKNWTILFPVTTYVWATMIAQNTQFTEYLIYKF